MNDVKEFIRVADREAKLAQKRPASILTAISPLMLQRIIGWGEEANDRKSKKGKKK